MRPRARTAKDRTGAKIQFQEARRGGKPGVGHILSPALGTACHTAATASPGALELALACWMKR